MDSKRNFQPDRNLRSMDQVRQVLRYHHYRYRTEQTYCKWILLYIRHHGGITHPATMEKTEIESFLSHLAVQERVSASTQRQALNAIMFLYRKVLCKDIRDKIAQGYGSVYIPAALKRKYPNASREFRWQYLFPANRMSFDPRSHNKQRHHVLESGLQKAVKRAADDMGILKRVGCHTLRHCFATHALENGCNIRIVQELMSHSGVSRSPDIPITYISGCRIESGMTE